MSEKLGEMLMRAGLVSEAQLKTGIETQKQVGGKLGTLLVKLRYIPEERLVNFLGRELNLPVLSLKHLVVSPQVSALMDVEVLERHLILPLSKGEDGLRLAMADPLDYEAMDEVRFLTGMSVRAEVASRTNIQKAIDYYCHGQDCQEIKEAEKAQAEARKSGAAEAAVAGAASVPLGGASPTATLQALVDLLVEKRVIGREELSAKLARIK